MAKNITINPKKAAISVGAVFAICHILWIVMVAFMGSGALALVSGMHFVGGVETMPFDVATAVMGIVSALIVGAITGVIFALVWNNVK